MGKVKKGVKCSIDGCDELAIRSLSREELSKGGLKVSNEGGRRAYLCSTHYKLWKKSVKKSRELERIRYEF
ncbi:MAG: hypothetical protein RMJ31_03650 [Nitrososphaerota archaeon]|nr:hypothetical protein [Nitrososphaerales archaeon]MDW8044851.1 hypothetical protein [Nitrososphaerota archaeon]